MMDILEASLYSHLYRENYNNYEQGWGASVEDRDDVFLTSLCDYFAERMSKEEFFNGSGDSQTWAPLVAQHGNIANALLKKDLATVHETFRHFCNTSLTTGLIEGKFLQNEDQQKKLTFRIFDRLVSTAEAAGIIKCYNPEDTTFESIMKEKPEVFLGALGEKYQFDISAPKFQGGCFGINTDFGVYSMRDIFSMHLALVVSEKHPDRSISICEIGGGIGHFMYYLYKLGYRNLSVVDLPTVSTLQMYFLGTNLPKDHGIRFLSPDEFTGDYDLCANSDSFIEMSRVSASTYLNKIKKNGKHLISVNQETGPAQFNDGFRVCDIANMRRTNRQNSWVRRGWVFEEYISDRI